MPHLSIMPLYAADSRPSKMFLLVEGFLVCLLIGLLLGNAWAASSASEVKTKVLRYEFTLKNNTGKLIDRARFMTYAPVKKTSRQLCRKLVVSHPYELSEDELGNQVLKFDFANLPPFASKVITIKTELVLNATKQTADKKEDMPSIFLETEKFVETKDPLITKTSEELKGSTDLETARSVYAWVTENIVYSGFAAEEQGALWALKNKKGDCTEFMDLFAALARANGIPVRRVAGYVMPESGQLSPADFHNWAEFYTEGAWQVADPQKKKFITDEDDYIAFRIIAPNNENPMGDYNRFRLMGDGLTVKMNNE